MEKGIIVNAMLVTNKVVMTEFCLTKEGLLLRLPTKFDSELLTAVMIQYKTKFMREVVVNIPKNIKH